MAYSIDAITDSYYPGITCLINKLGIMDQLIDFFEDAIQIPRMDIGLYLS